MTDLPHCLTRSLVIRAPRAVVFRYFTDSARFASWWGQGSTIDPEVGGKVEIHYPGTVVAQGTITALAADRRIAFTYGYANAHPELPVGASLVTIELHDHADGTRVEFRHDLPAEKLRDQHAPGWRYHLAVFANVVANEHHGNATARIDQWFAAWAETDGQRRREQLAACATEQVSVRDAYACLIGLQDLDGHIANTHVHLPGMVMRRSGEPRQCQGTVLVEWTADDPTGKALARGTNVVRLAADGRIADVVGFAG